GGGGRRGTRPAKAAAGFGAEMGTNRSRSSKGTDGSRASSRTRSLKSSQLSSRLMTRLGSGGASSSRRVAVAVARLPLIEGSRMAPPIGVGAGPEVAQGAEVDGVELLAALGPLGGLQDHRQGGESRVVDQAPE